jgi:hypothetical protein
MNAMRFEEQGVLLKAREVHKQYNKSREAWVQSFLTGLSDLGEQRGYRIASEAVEGRWMTDLTWLRCRHADLSDFDGLALACQVVWETPDEVLRQRLLTLALLRAEVRLFIFNSSSPGRHQEVLEKAKTWLNFPMVSPGRIMLLSSGNADKDVQLSVIELM